MSGPATLELGLTLRTQGRDHDVLVEARADATVGELADALARHVGAAAQGYVYSDRGGRLAAAEPLLRAGICDGDVVSLDGPVAPRVPSPRGSTGPVVALGVTGGPVAGTRVALGPGRYVVGRESGVDVPIADASLSRRHFAIEIGRDGGVSVADAGSSNGTAIEGIGLPEGLHPLAVGQTIEAGRSTFTVEPWATPMRRTIRAGAIDFNRQPRVSRGYEPPTLRLDQPPQKLRALSIPFVVALVPLLMGVVIYLVTKSPLMLLMGAFSPIMMIGSAMGNKRAGKREHGEQVAAFEASAAQLRSQLGEARDREQRERRAAAPHAAELVARALEVRDDLWERRPTDRDFLDVRVGTADQPSIVQVVFQAGGDPEMRAPVEALIDGHRTVPVVPVLLRFSDLGTVGLVGDQDAVDGLGRWIMLQQATLQSPRDVVIAAALSPERAERWRWLSWLPHTRHAASPIDGEHVAVGEHASRTLLRAIAAVADERREENNDRKSARRRTSIVLLVDEDVEPEATVIDGLLQDCAAVDIAVVWLGRERRHLPGAAGAIVEAAADRAVIDVTFTRTGQVISEASIDAVELAAADAVARSLAPLRDVTAGGAAAAIPRSVSLVEVLDLIQPTPERVRASWARRDGASLGAIVGIASDGPFRLDLRTHGPHALVAGTTGAGKSEFLQTLIVSLAAAHPPDRLAFLLVDYKGGAAFKDCAGLPHSVGMVTDLDAHEVRRALVSLNAELKRREHVLAEHDARDLMELERRDPASAPPNLVIVIDEFATLAKEVPAFVDGVVDVAQRGRSLGVHVVLATQRPGNHVNENIRANMSLRVALRVAGTMESDDVIGVPDAARLPRSVPGRALARTSPTELEQFQAGYVGGLTELAGGGDRVEVRDRVQRPTPTTKGGSPIEPTDTDLELLVGAIAGATEQAGIAAPPSPWEPPLPAVLPLDGLPAAAPRGAVAVGLIDEPTRQRQVPYLLDLARVGSALVYGGSGAGKTTALRTIASALASAHDPSELHLYGLDFAGMGLQPLEALPHVGSVIPGDDGERLGRLLAVLRRAIDDRGRRFAGARVNDLAGYNAARPDDRLPRIVVLLDSYSGFTDAYERVDLGAMVEAVPRLIADGRAAGVHFIITADRRAAVPTAVASLISERLVLRMASTDELQMLGVDTRSLEGVELPSGRGFLADGRDVQLAVAGGTADAREQVAAIEALGEVYAAGSPHRATPIASLPEAVPLAALRDDAARPLTASFAIDDLDLAPISVSLEDAHFVVIGPYRSGRSTALHSVASQLRAATPGLTIHLLAPRRSRLPDLDGVWDSVSRGLEQSEERVRAVMDELLAGTITDQPTLLVIDDAGEFASSAVESTLETLLKRGRDGQLRILASMETGEARHYAAWVKELRKDGRGLLLDPNLDLDGDLLGVRLPRRSNAIFPPGRGFVVVDGRIVLAQVAQDDQLA